MIAFADAVESITGCDNPGIGGGAFQIFPIVFKDRWIFWRKRGEIVDGRVDTCCEAGGRDIVAKNPAIHNLCEKSRLRDQLAHELRDIFLPLRSEGFLVAGAASKSDYYDLLFAGERCGSSQWRAQKCAPQSQTCCVAQKVAAGRGNQLSIGQACFHRRLPLCASVPSVVNNLYHRGHREHRGRLLSCRILFRIHKLSNFSLLLVELRKVLGAETLINLQLY